MRKGDAVEKVTIIVAHSFPKEPLPNELHARGARPSVCIGADELYTPSDLQLAALRTFTSREVDVSINAPFAGRYVPLLRYGVDDRVKTIMIEMRRDCYLTRAGALDEVRAHS